MWQHGMAWHGCSASLAALTIVYVSHEWLHMAQAAEVEAVALEMMRVVVCLICRLYR